MKRTIEQTSKHAEEHRPIQPVDAAQKPAVMGDAKRLTGSISLE
jgi:hypothetical protein